MKNYDLVAWAKIPDQRGSVHPGPMTRGRLGREKPSDGNLLEGGKTC